MILENVTEMWTEVCDPEARSLHDHALPHIRACMHHGTSCPNLHAHDFHSQIPKTGKGQKGSRPVNKDRFISKMFLRGDSVILVLRNPK